ncbi:MAG: hypothetical protein A2452_09985 [Candidatus Firestonebacteria bacterium RIFOXYC2_FULL_39_67]|nr:MAG: hypothetical protein A2536_04295 [Candidatus Firestonebacteria bacterium RIFOXYD2_FULL_39_29]OGF53709.1 MAG: hypothetical protein A2497_05355 [Candidatus Firestonebacteria bacterium RifOxyC12_full_39_7]OGF55122.1 MAG: hypothetical protein A2452_09985 [Candidatus Firestonebacteria bacterium RIFOXYC2_FULL_39_67]
MNEREDLLKTVELCERILAKDPANKIMLEKIEASKKKLRLIERRLTDNSEENKQEKSIQQKKKSSGNTEYL